MKNQKPTINNFVAKHMHKTCRPSVEPNKKQDVEHDIRYQILADINELKEQKTDE